MKSVIRRMHVESCNTSTTTPRERRERAVAVDGGRLTPCVLQRVHFPVQHDAAPLNAPVVPAPENAPVVYEH